MSRRGTVSVNGCPVCSAAIVFAGVSPATVYAIAIAQATSMGLDIIVRDLCPSCREVHERVLAKTASRPVAEAIQRIKREGTS